LQLGGADLFGGVAQAGGEEEIASKGPIGAGLGASAPADEKLTGQRNENSVLFSLSALTGDSKGGPPPAPKDRTTAQADGSGLIDIRALSANMSSGDKSNKNHVDDIMNLSGGGAFGAALAAPILAPPPMADIPGQPGYSGESENKGNKTLLIGLLGGGGLIAGIAAYVKRLRPHIKIIGVDPEGSILGGRDASVSSHASIVAVPVSSSVARILGHSSGATGPS